MPLNIETGPKSAGDGSKPVETASRSFSPGSAIEEEIALRHEAAWLNVRRDLGFDAHTETCPEFFRPSRCELSDLPSVGEMRIASDGLMIIKYDRGLCQAALTGKQYERPYYRENLFYSGDTSFDLQATLHHESAHGLCLALHISRISDIDELLYGLRNKEAEPHLHKKAAARVTELMGNCLVLPNGMGDLLAWWEGLAEALSIHAMIETGSSDTIQIAAHHIGKCMAMNEFGRKETILKAFPQLVPCGDLIRDTFEEYRRIPFPAGKEALINGLTHVVNSLADGKSFAEIAEHPFRSFINSGYSQDEP